MDAVEVNKLSDILVDTWTMVVYSSLKWEAARVTPATLLGALLLKWIRL
jgi:hypothetical protein